jgi:heme-degrading monooxygenase HmoA
MNFIEHSISRRSIVATGAAATGLALASPLARAQTGSGSAKQAIIRTDARVITLVNMFTVEPGNLASLLGVLRDGTETFFSKMPGFVSSSVLTARDGRRAINYSQWRSTDDIAAFRQDPRFAPYIQRLQALATAEGLEYEVAYVNSV